ncbi:hypothetical protein ABIA48_001851 [Pseudomonas sp. S30_BP2TU TE3576]
MDKGIEFVNNTYVAQAKAHLSAIGVHQLSEGVWAFTDVHTASQAYIHHSLQPLALAAYAVVNPTFAAGRFPNISATGSIRRQLQKPVPSCSVFTRLFNLQGLPG